MTEEMKQCVLKIHKNKIQPHTRTRTNGKQYILWETKVERKRKITANTYDILLQKLFDYYSGSLDRRKTPSLKLANLFVRFIKWKSEEDISEKNLEKSMFFKVFSFEATTGFELKNRTKKPYKIRKGARSVPLVHPLVHPCLHSFLINFAPILFFKIMSTMEKFLVGFGKKAHFNFCIG